MKRLLNFWSYKYYKTKRDNSDSVVVYKHDDIELVSLFFMPNHDRHDQNNIYFGNCTFDDILNIEEIIRKRKEYYANQ